nr:MAG TPA: hypothetical protein [Caudoviricetes sp.]
MIVWLDPHSGHLINKHVPFLLFQFYIFNYNK